VRLSLLKPLPLTSYAMAQPHPPKGPVDALQGMINAIVSAS
jgi:hypothetical protein